MEKNVKNILYSALLIAGLMSLSGCGSKEVEPALVVPYLSFDKGTVVNSQKVLIDGSHQTLISGETTAEKGQVSLYKMTIFFKDKSYVIFVSKEAKVGSVIEFILKDEKLTNIQF
jgi:hypothetical protein